MSREQIKEEMGVHKEWYIEAKKQTPATFPAFLKHLIEDYDHDYGTICHAASAAALGAACAVDKSDQGGITGFQAGFIMWGFIHHWMGYEDQPLKLLKYEDMLYPQYADRFQTISASTWDWLQQQARKNLAEKTDAHPAVIDHWASISEGTVPFGYQVEVVKEPE